MSEERQDVADDEAISAADGKKALLDFRERDFAPTTLA
jgi:hypothetical protein